VWPAIAACSHFNLGMQGKTGVKSVAYVPITYVNGMFRMTMRIYIWMMPWVSLLLLEQFGEWHKLHNETISKYTGKLKSFRFMVLYREAQSRVAFS
jgi:hypothetical protein